MPSQLRRNFWWLWFSLFAAVVSLVVLQSKILLVPSVASLGLALNRLLQSQMVITEANGTNMPGAASLRRHILICIGQYHEGKMDTAKDRHEINK